MVAGLRATLPKVKAWICIDADAPDAGALAAGVVRGSARHTPAESTSTWTT